MKETIKQAIGNDQFDKLYSKLSDVYDQVKSESRIDVFGSLDFEVVRSIDGKKQRIAKLKGNKILVHVNARRLPKTALKYVVVHELAHSIMKGHQRGFWKVVKSIYPNFETGHNLLMKHGSKILKQEVLSST